MSGKSRGRPNRHSGNIYDTNEFAQLFDYERDRSFRSGLPISLVILDVNPGYSGMPECRRMVKALTTLVRIVDHIGWRDENRIGLLLPATDQAGARRVAENVDGLIDKNRAVRIGSVTTYPTNRNIEMAVSSSVPPGETIVQTDIEADLLLPFPESG